MQLFSIFQQHSSHIKYGLNRKRRFYRLAGGLRPDAQIVEGLVVEKEPETGQVIIPVGSGLPIGMEVAVKHKQMMFYDNSGYPNKEEQLSLIEDIPEAIKDEKEGALVLIRIEGPYKSSSHLNLKGRNSLFIFKERVSGHKASWDEALVKFRPDGEVEYVGSWKTANNEGRYKLVIVWDGKELKIGPPDEVDNPSRWTLEGAEVL